MMRMEAGVAASRPADLRVRTALSDIDGLLHQREFQMEGGALAGAALHPDLAGVLLDDAVGDRESQPGAAPLALVGRALGDEEGIVDAVDVLLRDAGAGVADGHVHSRAV